MSSETADGGARGREVLGMGRVSVWDREKVLDMTVVMAAELCACPYATAHSHLAEAVHFTLRVFHHMNKKLKKAIKGSPSPKTKGGSKVGSKGAPQGRAAHVWGCPRWVSHRGDLSTVGLTSHQRAGMALAGPTYLVPFLPLAVNCHQPLGAVPRQWGALTSDSRHCP